MRIDRRTWSWVIIVLGVRLALPALADDNGANRVLEISDIIVTARRIEERLQDVPISMTTFSERQLQDLNIAEGNDLANFTPSLSANTEFGPDNTSFSIRGFAQAVRTSASVATYFGDVVEPRSGGIGVGGTDGAAPGDFFDLQNVEVLKGPQGTLFGRNTTGGAVLLVPVKPTDNFEGYVEASGGDYSMERFQGVVNLSITPNIRMRLGFDQQTQDGYIKNISGIGPGDFGNVNYQSYRASLVVDITPQIENYSILRYSVSNNNGIVTQDFVCNPKSPFAFFACPQVAAIQGQGYYTVQNQMADPRTDSTRLQFSNTTTWSAADTLTVKNILSYARLKTLYDEDIFGSAWTLPTLPHPLSFLSGLPVSTVNAQQAPGRNSNYQQTATEESQLQGWPNDALFWQAGVYTEYSWPIADQGSLSDSFISCTRTFYCIDSLALLAGMAPGSLGSESSSVGSISFHNYGIYAQSTYSILSNLKVTTGLRYTYDVTSGEGGVVNYRYPSPTNPALYDTSCAFSTAALASNCQESAEQKSKAPTGLIDFEYTPIENLMAYIKYSRGYRQGSVDPFAGTGLSQFAPEHVDAYEFGAKTSFNGPIRGNFSFAAFYSKLYDQQLQGTAYSSANLAPPAAVIVNSGTSHTYGLEVDSALLLFKGFKLSLDATYLATKLLSENASLPTNSAYDELFPATGAGQQLPLSPLWKTVLGAAYTLPIPANIGPITFSSTYVHSDRQVVTATLYGELPATDVVNLSSNWDSIASSNFSASFFMNNATNRQYPTYIDGVYAQFGFESRPPAPPRTYGFRVRYSFGKRRPPLD